MHQRQSTKEQQWKGIEAVSHRQGISAKGHAAWEATTRACIACKFSLYDVQVVHFTAHVNVTLGATKRKVNGRKVGSRKAAVVAAAAAVAAVVAAA